MVLKRLLYRQEVGELAVEELLQLALVEFVFVSIVSGVVVENSDQCIHRTLELARHSAAGRRDSSWKVEKKNPNLLIHLVEQKILVIGDVSVSVSGRAALTWSEWHPNGKRSCLRACL